MRIVESIGKVDSKSALIDAFALLTDRRVDEIPLSFDNSSKDAAMAEIEDRSRAVLAARAFRAACIAVELVSE